MYKYVFYEKYGIKLLTFTSLSEAGGVKHCFTTRGGGVSTGDCDSLNFSKSRDVCDQNVNENARRLAEILEVDYNKLTAVPQVHGCDVKVVTEADCGAGFSKPRFEEGYDAMITNVKGIPLMTLHGDCVPIFLYDPEKRVVGMVHSGWKGTARKVVSCTVQKMQETYGCAPENIIAAIGPSIGIDCFEIDMPAYEELLKSFPEMEEYSHLVIPGRLPSKKQVSLGGLVELSLLKSGIKKENITNSEICTCCEKNKDEYFSHRRTGGKTGIMAGVICLVQ